MKKTIALCAALIVCFAFVLLAACGKDTQTADSTQAAAAEDAGTTVEDAATTDDSAAAEDTATVEDVSATEKSGNVSGVFEFSMPEITAHSGVNTDAINVSVEPFTFSVDITPAAVAELPTIYQEIKVFSIDDIDIVAAKGVDASSVPEETLQKAARTQKNLLAKLTDAFTAAGLNVKVDSATGEVSLDSSVLFGGDSAVLSADGKAFLNKFINAYSSVMLDAEFDGFISKIMVEGHTAPVAGDTFEDGLPLSQERAKVVRSYCLSDEAGISSQSRTTLSSLMEAAGLSNSYPVRNADGSVDMAASRRVAFRFIVNLG